MKSGEVSLKEITEKYHVDEDKVTLLSESVKYPVITFEGIDKNIKVAYWVLYLPVVKQNKWIILLRTS